MEALLLRYFVREFVVLVFFLPFIFKKKGQEIKCSLTVVDKK